MNTSFEQLLPLARQLDITYARALDRLEAQVNESAGLNHDVQAILQQDNIEVMPFSADSSNSPREVYNAFANALAGKVLGQLAIAPAKEGYRIADLVDWSDLPPRGGLSDQDYQLAKIAFARGKSMEAFLQQLVIRFSPASLPEASIHFALQDLIAVFSVSTAVGIAIPVRREDSAPILRHVFHRREDEPMWHLVQRHHKAVIRGTNAMSTIALLNKQSGIAASLSDMLNAMDVRLGQTLMRYDPGQTFHGATFAKIALQRDGADFHLGGSMFEMVRTALTQHVRDVNLVFH